MSGKAAKIVLTDQQQRILNEIERSRTAAAALIRRSRVILLGFVGALNARISEEVGLSRKQVGRWRRRWQQAFDLLVAIECRETDAALRRAIEKVLSDEPRCGSPGKFTAEQVTHILAVACEPPDQSDRPINAWTPRELADEVIQRNWESKASRES